MSRVYGRQSDEERYQTLFADGLSNSLYCCDLRARVSRIGVSQPDITIRFEGIHRKNQRFLEAQHYLSQQL